MVTSIVTVTETETEVVTETETITETVVVTSIVTETVEVEVEVEVPVEVMVEAEQMGPTGAGLLDLGDSALAGKSWDEILAAAEGTRVNWFMWGGSAVINAYINGWVKTEARERYGIDLNHGAHHRHSQTLWTP